VENIAFILQKKVALTLITKAKVKGVFHASMWQKFWSVSQNVLKFAVKCYFHNRKKLHHIFAPNHLQTSKKGHF